MSGALTIGQAILLGIVQGLTEFLPVSSSGHLALAGAFLNVPGGGVAFAVLLHAGTLLAIALVFRTGVRDLSTGTIGIPRLLGTPFGEWPAGSRLAAFVAVATIPGAIVGLLLEDSIESMFSSPDVVAGLLLVTAAILLLPRWFGSSEREIGWRVAILVGCAQAFAILPGISRSGTTITAALLLGIARPRAAEFSFLAAIPLILGSLALKLPELAAQTGEVAALSAGFATSFLVGWGALLWLVRVVRAGRLHWFSAYCVLAGLAAILIPRVG